jgi:SseB protein N-terminal domain
MTNEFRPNNNLEEKLLALYRKEIKIIEFLELLIDSQVVILADRDVDISRPSMDFNPLAINSPMGFDVLVTFSSLERAKAALAQYPDYPFALAVDTRWFLLGAYKNAGIALNPGWPYGFELPPEGLQQLLVRLGVKKLSGQN